MIFNLANQQELGQAREYLNQIARLGKRVEIVRKAEHRSLNQNAYLHLILEYFGTQTGYTLEEAKVLYKRLNSDLYIYEKNGAKFLKSSADLSKEDMAKTIDRFMQYSEKEGVPLPLADNQDFLDLATNTVEAQQQYL
jgi:hypothetical protein